MGRVIQMGEIDETDAGRFREEACADEWYEEWRAGHLEPDPLDDPEQEMAGWVEWMAAPRTGYPEAQPLRDWVVERLAFLERMHGRPYEDAGPETRKTSDEKGHAA